MIHTIRIQGDLELFSRTYNEGFFTPTTVDPVILLAALLIISALGFSVSFGLNYYRRRKKFQEFEEELKTLDVNQDTQDAITQLVQLHALKEPLEILINDRKFDDLAAKAIVRILRSPGPRNSKERFINAVYEIRRKAFHSNYNQPGNPDDRAA